MRIRYPHMKRILGFGIAASVLTITLGLYFNHKNHGIYDPQLPARVLTVSPVQRVDLGWNHDRHYRLAHIEVTTQSGQQWYYDKLPVTTDVVPGMGLRVWLDDQSTGSGLIYEKASSTNGSDYVQTSPYLSVEYFLPIPLMAFMVGVMLGLFFSPGWPEITFAEKVRDDDEDELTPAE